MMIWMLYGLTLLCGVLVAKMLNYKNKAAVWENQYAVERAGHNVTKDDLTKARAMYAAEYNAHKDTKGALDKAELDLAGTRNDLKGLTADYAALAEEGKRIYAEKDQLNSLLEKQAKRLEKYEPKKTAPVKKAPTKAVAKKRAHGQHELEKKA